jgi:signal transduction histidine kinase
VTQQLALLSIDIGKLAAEIPSSVDEIRMRLHACQSHALEVANEVRRVSHGLHPSAIQDFGLSSALGELCDEFAKAQNISLVFDEPSEAFGLSADGASCLYRIAQEGLQNAAKHARATEIRVELSANGGNVQLVVRDNGAGFPAEENGARQGLGLVSMRERIRIANGTISITSQPGRGTEIVACVPLHGS